MTEPVPILLMVQEPGIGGTERQLVETARFLNRSRFTPHVGTLRPSGIRVAELQAAAVPLVTFPMHSFGSMSAIKALLQCRRYILEHRIQLVHTFDTPMNIFGVVAARLAGVPVVLSSQRAYRELSGSTYRRLLRFTDRLVNGVVVNCEAIRRHLIEDEHVAAGKISLCYNGIDIEQFPLRSPNNEGTVTIGIVCALRSEKNLSVLVDAFAGVLRTVNVPVKLLLVGSGPMREPLQQHIAELNITDAVQFEPTTREVSVWLKKIDIFVLPSLSEAFSNSLMEAMASGCAVIASNVGGNPELVTEGVTGLLFEKSSAEMLADKIRILIEQPSLRLELSAHAAARIRSEFTVGKAALGMEDIYARHLDDFSMGTLVDQRETESAQE